MKANLKINKEIIEDLYRNNNNTVSNTYINKLKEEIKLITSINDKLKEEINSLRSKVGYYEQITNDNLLNYRDSTESLKNKVFILENTIIKKDNTILSVNNKLNKLMEREIFNEYINFEKETFIIDPTTSINLIYDDLLLYKHGYENMSHAIKQEKMKLNEKNKLIEQLKTEINQLKEYNKSLSNINNIQLQSTNADDSSNTNNNNKTIPFQQGKKFFDPDLAEKYTTEEWVDIIKNINITTEELEILSRNQFFSKIIDGIELMNKVVVDKNMQISIINTENQLLNKKNSNLIDENVTLSKKLISFMQNINTTSEYKPEQTNVSMDFGDRKHVVQRCQTDISQEDSSITDEVFNRLTVLNNASKERSESSGHDSIIDLKALNSKSGEIDSCNSTEFKNGIQDVNNINSKRNSEFISVHADLENIKITDSIR